MMACRGRNKLSLFLIIKYKVAVFDEVYILSHFNIDFIVSLSYELTEKFGKQSILYLQPQNDSKYLHYD